ncbi:hypothetical protein Glove_120g176 [Diversispora epigaea]|uniref:Uncharacterized protein n=1 Tax=Diversispora epigaea TaxID=1348612 RepID=A0A397IZL9_9GLOM|nr:hypothetical protein Glove_120g176 [Diversispora epigaea]
MKKQICELYSNETSSDHSPNSSNSSSRDDEIKFDTKTYSKSQIQFQQSYINNNNNNNNDDIDNNNDDNINNPKIPSHSAVCPDFWAPPLNKFNCQIVYKNYDPEIDLSIREYYERIVKGKVMEKLLAIAGIRIAAVLTLFS